MAATVFMNTNVEVVRVEIKIVLWKVFRLYIKSTLEVEPFSDNVMLLLFQVKSVSDWDIFRQTEDLECRPLLQETIVKEANYISIFQEVIILTVCL